MAIPRRRPSAGTVLGALALFVALGGPAEAAKLIDGARIKKGSITARAIKPGVLTGRLMAVASIPGDRLVNQSVGLSKLAPDALAQLTRTPPDEVTGPKVADHSLGATDLADDSLGQAQIARDGVGATEVAADSVDTDEVADGRLTARDVASFAGTFKQDFGSVAPGTCESIEIPAVPIFPRPGLTIADDAVVVTAAAAPPLPPELVLQARPSGPSSIRVWACNITSRAMDPPPTELRYLSFEF